MRRAMMGVVLVAGLAGCAVPGPVEPQAARLSREVLTVTLSDGTICRADWAAAGAAGRLEPCGPGFDYRVTVVERPNLLRQLWSGLTEALGAEGLVPPLAQVEISAGGEVWTFTSPAEE
ncbi:hypothetical protein [Paragemmobacter ruber]|uniref:Lipoprotein n=1 Tax=Paragemmobacter ruber TaxID=1985673 RepID=A0ABW9Y6H0_9RHOB|nr:hypothetical protein [Rhodobacter ruber]NBE07784.1 hypothetical protein [Rhodobacter ruber]